MGEYTEILKRNSLAEALKLPPQERQTWLDENARRIAELEACPRCGNPLGSEAVYEHLCCKCLDFGFIGPSQDITQTQFKAVPCECRRTGITEREYLRRSGVPAELARYTLEGWPGAEQVRSLAENFVREWPPAKHLMFLTGDVGTGKSGLASAVLRELWQRHRLVGRFVTAPDLIRRFHATFEDEAQESKEDIHREIDLAPLVVLDDYGTQKDTEFVQTEMFRLINGRHSNGKPLIVTTNLSVMSLDPRIKSRMVDVDRSHYVQLSGQDWRQR